MTAILTPTEDRVFDAVWGLIASYFDPSDQGAIFKGFQNQTSTPPGGNYAVISPGVKERQNQIERTYDPVLGTQITTQRVTYSYQVDCYGPQGPDWAATIGFAWGTLWSFDNNEQASVFAPLYADAPQQLNIVNGELQFEQRFTVKLYLQVNHTVALPQEFFTEAPDVELVVADLLPET